MLHSSSVQLAPQELQVTKTKTEDLEKDRVSSYVIDIHTVFQENLQSKVILYQLEQRYFPNPSLLLLKENVVLNIRSRELIGLYDENWPGTPRKSSCSAPKTLGAHKRSEAMGAWGELCLYQTSLREPHAAATDK